MLICSDNTIYSGYTVNLSNRLKNHNLGTASKYTRTRRPVKLAYYEEFDTKSEAMKREAYYKSLARCEKLIMIEEFEKNIKE